MQTQRTPVLTRDGPDHPYAARLPQRDVRVEKPARPVALREARLAALVQQAQRGSRRAFDALWERYAPTVHGILLGMVHESEAEDLAQDVAIHAFRSIGSLKKPASFPAWLCAIARNTGRDALAARRRSPETSLDEGPGAEIQAPSNGDPLAADEILAQIRALPECYREPLMLRLLLQMSGPSIASHTGMTEGSVRVNLCRGMKLLRQRLKRWDSDEA